MSWFSYENEEEELEQDGDESVRVFAEYQPDNNVPGEKHPADLSEGAGLANVESPKITHKLMIHDQGGFKLSAPQNQAVIYATQANNDFYEIEGVRYRKGFLLGDGTGVGKTLTLVGIVYEAMLNGYINKVLWVVPNKDLGIAAIAEVKKMSPDLDCWDLCNLKESDYCKSGIVFVTYTYVSSEPNQDKVLKWMGEDFDGMLIFDECHFIKSAHSPVRKSRTGLFLVDCQENYPNCRVVYSSATAASEPYHLLCLQRLHFWGKGTKCKTSKDFARQMYKMGVAGMELVSLDMKRRGVFLSRLISFKNVKVDLLDISLTEDYLEVYNKSCELFMVLLVALQNRSTGKDGWEVMGKRCSFYGEMLRYFGCLMVSGKIKSVAERIVNDYNHGKSIVVTIQHTGESGFFPNGSPYCKLEKCLKRIYKLLNVNLEPGMLYVTKKSGLQNAAFDLPKDKSSDEEDDDDSKDDYESLPISEFTAPVGNLIQTARNIGCGLDAERPPTKKLKLENVGFLDYSLAVLENINTYFNERKMAPSDFTWSAENFCSDTTDERLVRLFYEIRPFLPINPLDELTDRLGSMLKGHPCDIVANGTGRNFFYVKDGGKWAVEKTKSRDQEIKDFMDLKKRIIVISDAVSVGVSLHSDRNRKNQQERVHVILELPWSPDKLVQTLGRTLRSNSASIPLYVVVKTDIPAEARFVCVIEERMKQMGAICQGQSQASILASHFSTNLNSHGTVSAISSTIDKYSGNEDQVSLLKLLGIEKSSGAHDVQKYINKTFNRLMMLPIKAQLHFFQIMNEEIRKLTPDDGIFSDLAGIDIPGGSWDADVAQIKVQEWQLENGAVQLRTLRIYRTFTLQNLEEKIAAERATYGNELPGFYRTVVGEVCYVVKKGTPGGQDWCYFVPYCRELLTMKLPRNFKSTSEELGKLQWEIKIQEYTRKPGCLCWKETIKCKQGLCTRKSGTVEIYVICGFTYNIFGEIEIATNSANSKIRLARVTWKDKGNLHHDVGLLLESAVAKLLGFELDRKFAIEQYKKKQKA